MRASILVLGPILSKIWSLWSFTSRWLCNWSKTCWFTPKSTWTNGCKIEILHGYIRATAPNGLKGAKIVFDKVTVGGTENTVMAAALAHGTTTIINAAKEPEIVQLCEVIRDAGVKVEGIGTSKNYNWRNWAKLLDIKPFDVIPDRIEAGTYMCAAAIKNQKTKNIEKSNSLYI